MGRKQPVNEIWPVYVTKEKNSSKDSAKIVP